MLVLFQLIRLMSKLVVISHSITFTTFISRLPSVFVAGLVQITLDSVDPSVDISIVQRGIFIAVPDYTCVTYQTRRVFR